MLGLSSLPKLYVFQCPPLLCRIYFFSSPDCSLPPLQSQVQIISPPRLYPSWPWLVCFTFFFHSSGPSEKSSPRRSTILMAAWSFFCILPFPSLFSDPIVCLPFQNSSIGFFPDFLVDFSRACDDSPSSLTFFRRLGNVPA